MFENWIEIKSVKLRIREFDSHLEIWIPGTDDLGNDKKRKNALKDLGVSLMFWPNKNGRHAGADRMARLICDDKEFIALVIERKKPFRIAGHSMGAAIAECIAERLEDWALRFVSYGGYKVCFRRNGIRSYSVLRVIKGRDRIRWFCFWYFGKVGKRQDPGSGKWPKRFIYDHTHYEMPEAR